ncbi:MAG: hypothetical protein K2F83_05735, partial [Oscillospiraceae bacterium]|nr:hypothetical protein [Oscillospiraceae bacterium]
EEYNSICERQYHYFFGLYYNLSPTLRQLLDEFVAAIHDEMLLERKHAFLLGYQTAKESTEEP